MKNLPEKIKLLFLPFILLSLSFVIVYAFLHWLLTINLGLLQGINEDMLDYWIPFLILWVIVPLFMWKNIIKLRFSDGFRSSKLIYVLVAVFAVLAPTAIAVSYVRSATGKITRIATPEQFDTASMTKYYQIDSMYIDKDFSGLYWYYKIGGKYKAERTFYEFIAIPIMSSPSDTSGKEFGIWYGLAYEETIDNFLEENVKDSLFEVFRNRNMQHFMEADLNGVSYFDRIGTSTEREGLVEAAICTGLSGKSEPIILVPQYEVFESRNRLKLLWLFISYYLGAAVWLLLVLMKPLRDSEIVKKP
jgi:hypothetical protein